MAKHHSETEKIKQSMKFKMERKLQKYVNNIISAAVRFTYSCSNQNHKKPRRIQLANST